MELLIHSNFTCQGSVSIIIEEVKKYQPKYILYWNVTEFDISGDGLFLDNGKSMLDLIELLNEYNITMYIFMVYFYSIEDLENKLGNNHWHLHYQ